MFARLTTTVIGPEQEDAAAEIVERILPTLRSLAGFKGVLVLADDDKRVVHGMTLWENVAAMEKSETVVGGIRRAESRGRDVVSQEVHRLRVVAFHVDPI